MARVDAAGYADKWANRLSGAQADIRKGIEGVTIAPGKKAAAQVDLMLTNLLESINNGTWEAAVSAVTLDDWKNSALNKGLQRIAAGVTAAKPSQVDMATKLLAAVDSAVAKVNTTPRGDLETNINRSATFAREMAKSKGKIR